MSERVTLSEVLGRPITFATFKPHLKNFCRRGLTHLINHVAVGGRNKSFDTREIELSSLASEYTYSLHYHNIITRAELDKLDDFFIYASNSIPDIIVNTQDMSNFLPKYIVKLLDAPCPFPDYTDIKKNAVLFEYDPSEEALWEAYNNYVLNCIGSGETFDFDQKYQISITTSGTGNHPCHDRIETAWRYKSGLRTFICWGRLTILDVTYNFTEKSIELRKMKFDGFDKWYTAKEFVMERLSEYNYR